MTTLTIHFDGLSNHDPKWTPEDGVGPTLRTLVMSEAAYQRMVISVCRASGFPIEKDGHRGHIPPEKMVLFMQALDKAYSLEEVPAVRRYIVYLSRAASSAFQEMRALSWRFA